MAKTTMTVRAGTYMMRGEAADSGEQDLVSGFCSCSHNHGLLHGQGAIRDCDQPHYCWLCNRHASSNKVNCHRV